MESIFTFFDYREYLKFAYEEKKTKNKRLSQRALSKLIGCKSATHFSLVVTGKQNLSNDFIDKFAVFFLQSEKEIQYFKYLVLYNQAKTLAHQKEYYKLLLSFKESSVHKISYDEFEYFSHWYNVAIREALSVVDFTGVNLKELSHFLRPMVSIEKIKKSILLLIKLNLIKKIDGFYRANQQLISSGNTQHSLHLKLFNEQVNALATESLSSFGPNEKNHSTITLSADKESFLKIIEELRKCRKKILSIVEESEEVNQLFLLNMNFFPLSIKHETKQK